MRNNSAVGVGRCRLLPLEDAQSTAGQRRGWRAELGSSLVVAGMGLFLVVGRNWPAGVDIAVDVAAALFGAYQVVTVTRSVRTLRKLS